MLVTLELAYTAANKMFLLCDGLVCPFARFMQTDLCKSIPEVISSVNVKAYSAEQRDAHQRCIIHKRNRDLA
ncbi:hypothetical protein B4O99_15510 [Shewanella xiamenensis]|nr:hypothetical protein CEQ32_07690 [Shewanella sp. FDAARGOS_354]MBW0280927.1 hypothetical protein [Shewanella xiamenensis]TVL32399.1 hypothetical protein AYI95_09490 [Shewanella xiamenensis]